LNHTCRVYYILENAKYYLQFVLKLCIWLVTNVTFTDVEKAFDPTKRSTV